MIEIADYMACPRGCGARAEPAPRYGLYVGTLIRPSHRFLLFSSQEYSIISQSGLRVKVRVLFHRFVKVLGSSTIISDER